MLGGKHIVFKTAVQVRGVRQNAFKKRRCDGNHKQLRLLKLLFRLLQFIVAEIHNILAVPNTQLGPGHANLLHHRDSLRKHR